MKYKRRILIYDENNGLLEVFWWNKNKSWWCWRPWGCINYATGKKIESVAEMDDNSMDGVLGTGQVITLEYFLQDENKLGLNDLYEKPLRQIPPNYFKESK